MLTTFANGNILQPEDPPMSATHYDWGASENFHNKNGNVPIWAYFNRETGNYDLPPVTIRKEPVYIGGTPEEVRQKFWQQDPEFAYGVDSIANAYDISPELLKHRLNHEGFVDESVRLNNKYASKGDTFLYGKDLLNDQDYFDGFYDFGLDDAGTFIKDGTVKLINEDWYDGEAKNENGRTVNYADGAMVKDNIGIMAATLNAFKRQAKIDHPEFNDHEAEMYAQMRYNRGAKGARDYYKKNGFKNYNFKADGGPLEDSVYNQNNLIPDDYDIWYQLKNQVRGEDTDSVYNWRAFYDNEPFRRNAVVNPLLPIEHVPDTGYFGTSYKRENHPTYSGPEGGQWKEDINGNWTFVHSPLTATHLQQTADYIYEPGMDHQELPFYNGEYQLPTVDIIPQKPLVYQNEYANGGSIHINPANRGKFNATKRRTGKTTEELTHSKNPLTRKRAIFAQNARKWKHADGGYLEGQEYDVTPEEYLSLIQQGYKVDLV